MVGWKHQLNGHEFEQTPGDSEGQPGAYRPWGHKELHTTQRLNSNNTLVTSCKLTNLFEPPGPYLKIRTFSPASVDFVGIKWHHLC